MTDKNRRPTDRRTDIDRQKVTDRQTKIKTRQTDAQTDRDVYLSYEHCTCI